jgi:hypothetical protein
VAVAEDGRAFAGVKMGVRTGTLAVKFGWRVPVSESAHRNKELGIGAGSRQERLTGTRFSGNQSKNSTKRASEQSAPLMEPIAFEVMTPPKPFRALKVIMIEFRPSSRRGQVMVST